MLLAFIFCLFFVFYVYLIYPFILYIITKNRKNIRPNKSYIGDVTSQFRQAIDAVKQGTPLNEADLDNNKLMGLSEGQGNSFGAFKKRWL